MAARGTEQSRTITFDSDSLTIMIRIEANQDGTARVDGWLAPPQRREIEMKTSADSLTVASDEQGRFAFARVPRGTAQLIVRPGRARAERSRAVGGDPRAHPLTGQLGGACRMPRAERRSARSSRSLARAERLAREARERGLREGNAAAPRSAPAMSARGCGSWAGQKTGSSPTRGRCTRCTMAWPPGCWGSWPNGSPSRAAPSYGLRLLDRAEDLIAADDRGILLSPARPDPDADRGGQATR